MPVQQQYLVPPPAVVWVLGAFPRLLCFYYTLLVSSQSAPLDEFLGGVYPARICLGALEGKEQQKLP
ncbi:unnamed protein product [Linum trigynum]|uniref:Secreted protein n=1 Tax=Linum trigynum TaxID=586398 RepID=A0AAV2CPW0_9ROSI